MTRIAVLSDIHGFNLAFDRVLADIDGQGPFDHIVVAGDLCEIGPGPRQVIDTIRSRGLAAIHGNTDIAIVEGARDGTEDPEVAFAIDRIGSDGVDFLADLPFSVRIPAPGGRSPDDDLLIVHATPYSLIDRFDPEYSDSELSDVVGPCVAGAIAFGHVHICFQRRVGTTLLLDVSAVGNPKDGELRSTYGIVEWSDDEARWSATLRRVDYPLEDTEEQLLASGVPKAKKVLKKLKRASYRS